MDGNNNTLAILIKNKLDSQEAIATCYYKLVFAAYEIKLTKTELAVVVHMALNGTISSPPTRDSFVEKYKTSKDSLNNMISSLQKKGLLVKGKDLKIRVHPSLMHEFNKDEYDFRINIKGTWTA